MKREPAERRIARVIRQTVTAPWFMRRMAQASHSEAAINAAVTALRILADELDPGGGQEPPPERSDPDPDAH